jgi:hypothetical protein
MTMQPRQRAFPPAPPRRHAFPHPHSGFNEGQGLCALPPDSSRSTLTQ